MRSSPPRTRIDAGTIRSTEALAATPPTRAAASDQDPFLVASTRSPTLPPLEALPEGTLRPGQSTDEWLEQEFALERERQVRDWEAFDAEPENEVVSAPLRAQIIDHFDASMPMLSGLRTYDAQCRGERCMVTVEWDRLIDAQNAMEHLIAQPYPHCARAIYLTPDGLGTEDAPYQQVISMQCEAS